MRSFKEKLINKLKEKNLSTWISWQPFVQDSKAIPDFCRKKSKWLFQNNALISQVSNKSRWALPFSSHLVWCVRPTTLPNHLVNVEKGKAEWFTVRSNGGRDQDFRFVSTTSALHCHWTPIPAGTDHATGTKPPAPDNYFYSFSRLSKFLLCYQWL